MTFDDIARNFGLPGLLILVWYLLEIQKGRRAEKADEARNKIEEQKVVAMTVGFQSLNSKIDDHQAAEFEHHARVRETIAGMHTAFATQFDLTPPPQEPPRKPVTPARGTYFLGRAGTKGGHDQG